MKKILLATLVVSALVYAAMGVPTSAASQVAQNFLMTGTGATTQMTLGGQLQCGVQVNTPAGNFQGIPQFSTDGTTWNTATWINNGTIGAPGWYIGTNPSVVPPNYFRFYFSSFSGAYISGQTVCGDSLPPTAGSGSGSITACSTGGSIAYLQCIGLAASPGPSPQTGAAAITEDFGAGQILIGANNTPQPATQSGINCQTQGVTNHNAYGCDWYMQAPFPATSAEPVVGSGCIHMYKNAWSAAEPGLANISPPQSVILHRDICSEGEGTQGEINMDLVVQGAGNQPCYSGGAPFGFEPLSSTFNIRDSLGCATTYYSGATLNVGTSSNISTGPNASIFVGTPTGGGVSTASAKSIVHLDGQDPEFQAGPGSADGVGEYWWSTGIASTTYIGLRSQASDSCSSISATAFEIYTRKTGHAAFICGDANGNIGALGKFSATTGVQPNGGSGGYSAEDFPLGVSAVHPKLVTGECAVTATSTACTFPNSFAFADTTYSCTVTAEGTTPAADSYAKTSATQITIYTATSATYSYQCVR